MTSADALKSKALPGLAPAPQSHNGLGNIKPDGKSAQSVMPYACQTCSKRKVKCDKKFPICSTCHKSKLECFFVAPPQRRKRRLSEDASERPFRSRDSLPQEDLEDSVGLNHNTRTPQDTPISLRWGDTSTPGTGRLIAHKGRSRYINSDIWHNLGDDEMHHISDGESEQVEPVASDLSSGGSLNPLTGAFLGSFQRLLQYHPTHEKAMLLWNMHVEDVEPLCKVLHIPSATKMVERVSKQPEIASKAEECLLFSIYHFAATSMTEDECLQSMGSSRSALMQKYHSATSQALVNASFLRTTDLSVLQALVLFLKSCRYFFDSQTYWVLTGTAVRIGQCIGVHRDGESLGLPPFDAQMRRRLFYQLLPLDGIASQIAGTGAFTMPETWNTKPPLNLNDDQIWPGMTYTPEEQTGATEMIFCLSRICVGKHFATAGNPVSRTGLGQFNNYHDAENAINRAENELEEKYIRYCDVVDPLHLLSMAMARSGITAMRIRIRLPKAKNNTATDAELRDLFQLAQRTLDTDAAAYAHAHMTKFRWHVKPFFLWGTWDSLIFVLTSLWTKHDILTAMETGSVWDKVEKVYHNHEELLEPKRALYLALGRLTLKAWDVCFDPTREFDPPFITNLRSMQKNMRAGGQNSRNALGETSSAMSIDSPSAGDISASMGDVSETSRPSADFDVDFDILATDWMFWDSLIKDHQTQE